MTWGAFPRMGFDVRYVDGDDLDIGGAAFSIGYPQIGFPFGS